MRGANTVASFSDLTKEQRAARLAQRREEYAAYKAQGLALDMSRGKPGPDQLDISMEVLDCVNYRDGAATESGVDTRNYGILDGTAEAKALFAEILGVPAETVIVGGNSSLNMMFDYITQAMVSGVCGGEPWMTCENRKFLCPVPGYDRHFAITARYGFEMIPVKMTAAGPDMDEVERLVSDPSVKGIWCVPMYSNPDGITYSDETVRRFARLKPAAKDFRIMWDNAYCVHHLTDTPDTLLNLYEEALAVGNEDIVVQFTSTSKISFPGAGVAAMAASPKNVADIKARMTVQTIGHDKINMLRHTRYYKNLEGVREHMKRHAAILRPKFDIVTDTLDKHLKGTGIAKWHDPNGGYFVSVNLLEGTASETVRLLKEAGVTLTPAGATYPHGKDPYDSTLRIAPSYPSQAELTIAMELFCICAEIAALEKLNG